MGKRGPTKDGKSRYGRLSLASSTDEPRPAPPEHLTKSQAAEWREIVAVMPVDWFGRESWPLLEALCRHICCARFISAKITDFVNAGSYTLQELNRWLAAQERESKAIASLSTKLRLSQQSGWCAKTAATAKNQNRPGAKLWEDPEDPASEFLD